MSEHDEQVTYFQTLSVNETAHPQLKWIFAVPNGGRRHPSVARKLKAEGVKAGIADICIPLPNRGFYGAWIEMKVKPNKCTPEQENFLAEMRSQGYATHVAYSCDEALKVTELYLGIKLNK